MHTVPVTAAADPDPDRRRRVVWNTRMRGHLVIQKGDREHGLPVWHAICHLEVPETVSEQHH
eukprot:3778666-Rhodomonas_salina.1